AWVRQDMTRLALHRPVAAVNCACDGVNYLTSPEAVAQCFAAVWRALLPGGFFVFDISTQEKLVAMDGELYGLDEDDVAYLWRNEMDPATRVLTMDITLFVSRGGGLFERLEETHHQRAHTHEELIEALARAGFVNVQAFSGLTGSPPQAGDLRRRYTAYRPE
ncbi:MAG: class I SAM-dependent methyltransferase, partial [Christensenellaceae bacterium]